MHAITALLLCSTALVGARPNDCAPSDACCQAGGTCGDAIFDTCEGSWDYRLRCYPSFRTCCIPNQPQTTTTTTTPQPTKPVVTTPGLTMPTGDTPEATDPTTPGPTLPPPAGDCGIRPLTSDPHIVGGVEAAPHSWPWAISLDFDYYGWGGWEHYCGGTLISKRHVLTAAHCIAKSGADGTDNFRIILGMHNQERSQWTGTERTVALETAFVHEDYSTTIAGSPNDIAILKLAEDVEFTAEIYPACLPSYKDQDFLGIENCYIAGFGLTKGTGREDVLNEAKIEVITNELCDYKWEAGSGRVNLIKESHICAGNGVPGTCNGDSGGPLQCEVDGRYILAGATSFGASGCTAADAPDAYTRISHFLPWIYEKMTL